MINVSAEFKNLMKYNTDFREYAEVTLADGTVFTLDDEHFTASNNNIVDGSGGNSFPLGVAIQKVIQIEILNEHERYRDYVFTGAKIRLYLTFRLSSTTERIEKGVYTVVNPETYGETIIITAYDDMYKADRLYFTGLVFPQSAGSVLRDICNNCGISLYSSDFLHNDFVISEKPEGTFREIIGHIAMIACGNARIDAAGYLRIITYDFDSWNAQNSYHTLEDFSNLKVEVNDTVITGIKMVVSGDEKDVEVLEGTNEYVLTVSNPLVSGKEQTLVSWIYEKLSNVPFRPFNGDHISNPLIEFMDYVVIHDRGNVYNSFITDVNFVFAGITTVKNVTPGALRQRSIYSSGNTRTEQLVKDLVKKERSDREEAIKKLDENITKASGMHVTEVAQEDGSKIIYMHDKPTLEESSNVMIITSNAVGFSTDGGKTYPFGFQIDGDMLAKILSAEGVSADWINTGALVIKDSEGKVIFSADISTGKVVISGDSVFIGNSTASEAIKEIKNDIALAKNIYLNMSNEYQAIPVDANGNYSLFPDCSTTVTVFYGSTDITSDCTFQTSKSSGIIGSWNNTLKKYTVTDINSDSGWVDITAIYASSLSVTKRFVITKQYAGENGIQGVNGRSYVLSQSSSVLKRKKDNTISPNYIQYTSYYIDGENTKRIENPGYFVIEETINGDTWSVIYESEFPEVSVRHDLYSLLAASSTKVLVSEEGTAIGIPREVVQIRCTLYDQTKSNILDIQSAAVVTDVDALTHEEIFNLLTNNGEVKGIYKEGDQLYISFTYAKGGELTLGGTNNGNGRLKILDSSGKQVGYIDNTGVHFNQGSFEGTITSGSGNIAGWTITKGSINSINNLIKLLSSGAIVLDDNGYLQIGNTKLTNSSHALKVDGGLWIYNGTEEFSDGTDHMRIYNLQHVTSGGHLVFGSDGATVCYAASSSKRYKDFERLLTNEDVKRAFDVDVVWAKYKEDYNLDKSDPFYGKYMPMFFAEDIEEKIPSAAVYKNGQIEDWNHRVMIPVMMQMIKDLQEQIDVLKSKVVL